MGSGKHHQYNGRRHVGLGARGFTLIELLITVVILGILATIAISEFR